MADEVVPTDFSDDVLVPIEIDPDKLPKKLKIADQNGIMLIGLEEYSELILDDSPIRERRGGRERFYLADKRLAIRLSAQGYSGHEIAVAINDRRRQEDLPVEGVDKRTVDSMLRKYKVEIDALRYLWRLQLGRFFKAADPIYRTRVIDSIASAISEDILAKLENKVIDEDLIKEIRILLAAFKHVQKDAGEDGSIKAFKYVVNEVRKRQGTDEKKKRLGIE